MQKKVALPISIGAVLVAVLAVLAIVVACAWNCRDTTESRRAARKEASKNLRACPPEQVLPFLEKLVSEKSFHTWFTTCEKGESSPWCFWTLRCGSLTAVPYDYIGQLTEDQFIRFAGDGATKPADVVRLKELLAFSEKLLNLNVLSKPAADALRERRLDGYFLSGDYDGAIAVLDQGGLKSRSEAWCKGTAAKLRAHKAMDAKNFKDAIQQLLIFGEFMLSDEQKDFEDCDPTTGIVYSRDWVVARNYMRCSKMSRDIGDTANADKYLVEAKKYFTTAHEKAKDDKKSLDSLRAEMKEDGFALPALPVPEAKPQEKPAAQ